MWSKERGTHVVAVYAIFYVTHLAVFTGIEACQKGDCVDLIFTWLVLVLEATRITLGTRAPQVMIMAELLAVLSLLDAVQRCLRHVERRV
jgi:hypothetical protein